MSDYGLAPLNAIGDPESLRRRAEEAIAGLEIDIRPGAALEGTDPSSSVWVSVRPDGVVADVSISRRWHERIPADQLGAAILAAYHQAEHKRALAGARTTDDDNGDSDAAPSPLTETDDPRWLEFVWETLNDSRRRLAQMSAPRLHEAAAEECTVAGPAGLVRLRVVGTSVRDVLIDGVHTARRDPEALAADVRSAFDGVRRG
ncbi:hypothetical protein [Nucisporomicrobium flavum]|uniref:hypothetical protein n=1 Tax=Nucisporomicrobium flavum TaxID=2785915 RepID=UPI0018F45838|nr:hypothetical protein [Nucisporomicrobium flavum]